MNDNEALVIGGVCDGTVFPADVPYRVGVNTMTQPLAEIMDPSAIVPTPPRSHYRLEWIRSGERKFGLYIEMNMSHEQAMGCLIERYRHTA